ncbi:hypothetical protein [Peptacetobacter hiranonis]|uniref:hypothetical protein n=1 Tax=Peptacetobacter hiranonis TaxID=89152 RepID=UPI002E76A310|nr:hypothetical protein [Peptacetobacter hiranonis]MEE0247402.1 hypothetical protein [Peptacetobacter hiranonis]
MNIIEALKIAKEQGKKVRPVGETAVCLVYIKSRDKFDMRNIETGRYVNTFDGATIKGIFADWEVVPDKKSKEIQYKIDSMKFQIVRYCDENKDCDDCYDCKIRCVCRAKPYQPIRTLLDDWNLKEIVEAYHILKEVGEI